jgi:PIN domain nuclease of toxin-antitoxin system
LKGYLVDSSVALLAADTPEVLSNPVRNCLENGPSFLSVISYWEVIVKAMKGMLDVGDPRQWWTETLEALALFPLPF